MRLQLGLLFLALLLPQQVDSESTPSGEATQAPGATGGAGAVGGTVAPGASVTATTAPLKPKPSQAGINVLQSSSVLLILLSLLLHLYY